jgi:hypothetical protein
MDMAKHPDYYKELDNVDREALEQAEGSYHRRGEGETRYSFYRRKGYSPEDALFYALNWCRNTGEQAQRRKEHMTGCL